jgi:aminoglycoside phosphotransferase (APT) family kinase protein
MNTLPLGPLLARGRTAEVYAWQNNQIIKLFYEWCPLNWVQHEAEISRAISTMTLPTPRLVDVLEIRGRQGIVYERVEGPSMLRLSSTKPWLLFRMARQLAELHSEIHRQKGNDFPPLRSSLRTTIRDVETLPSDLKTDVLRLLEELPDGSALCHLDFHPDQVLITPKGPVVIDWMTAHQGSPLADVARTSIMLMFGHVPYAGRVMRAVTNLWRQLFYPSYLARYLELHPGASRDEIRTWMVPVAAARLKEQIPGEQQQLLHFIQSSLSSI